MCSTPEHMFSTPKPKPVKTPARKTDEDLLSEGVSGRKFTSNRLELLLKYYTLYNRDAFGGALPKG